MKFRSCLAVCALLLSQAACIPDRWPEAWDPRPPSRDNQQQVWCYNTLAEIDCYEKPQSGAVGALVNPRKPVQKSVKVAAPAKLAKPTVKPAPSKQTAKAAPPRKKSAVAVAGKKLVKTGKIKKHRARSLMAATKCPPPQAKKSPKRKQAARRKPPTHKEARSSAASPASYTPSTPAPLNIIHKQ